MSESRDEVAAVKNYIYQSLCGRSESGNTGRKGISFFRLSQLYFQKGDRHEPESFYPCVPHGKGQGASTNHQHESSHGQRAGRICQFFVFLPELPGILRKQPGVLSERKQ